MDCMNFQFIPRGMTREHLEELFLEFYRTHFQRPKILLGYLAMLWRSPDSCLRFLRNLTDFVTFAKTNRRIRDDGGR